VGFPPLGSAVAVPGVISNHTTAALHTSAKREVRRPTLRVIMGMTFAGNGL